MISENTTTPVRWGVLGAANIAVRQVIPAMQRSGLCEMVAIASRDLRKAEGAAAQLGLQRAYGSYEALIADPDIEAIYNPLPNHLHVPWTIRAAEQGKHVLCEKPIALNAQQAEQLLAVQQRTGVQIAEAFMLRTHPQWLAARDLVTSGRIGELRLINGHFTYFRRDPDDVRSNPEWGGGALMDIGCYPITMSRWLFREEPTDVVAQLEYDPDMSIDRVGSALLRFPSGQAAFTFGGQVALHQQMKLFGTRGHITVEIPFNPPADRPTRITVDDGRDLLQGGAEVFTFAPANQFTIQGERFSAAVRGTATVAVTLQDSVSNMRVIDALFLSAQSRAWQSPAST
ncbi:MAG: Gfo/Idh/MocA family oxidoreductase [Phycisphaerae bacterium]|nr:Gfo/Idh/MocA family oxidoreductase [Gemmatimonadaceae bacterium]